MMDEINHQHFLSNERKNKFLEIDEAKVSRMRSPDVITSYFS
jgi:hypothetical protein